MSADIIMEKCSGENSSKKDRIAAFIRTKIRNGVYQSGDRIESVRELAAAFAVSLKIVTDALSMLEAEQLVRREAGRGVFVAPCSKILYAFCGGDIESPSHYFIPGVVERAAELHWQLERLPIAFLRNNGDNAELADKLRKNYYGVLYDAFYLVGNEPEVKIFSAAKLPVVLPHALTGDNRRTPFMAMHPDYREAFFDAARYLRRLGHRRIATLTFPGEDGFRDCTAAEYVDFMRSLGCEYTDEMMLFSRYAPGEITERVKEMLVWPRKATALLCISDFFAMHALNALHDCGVAVPQDLSVMGFCGYPGAGSLTPPLSSMDLMYHESGRHAVDCLLDSANWFGAPANMRFRLTPHKIIERQSVLPIKIKES